MPPITRRLIPPPTTAAQHLNHALLKHLECPSCLVLCTGAIYMCVNGHNVCNACSAAVKQCPKCCAPGRPSHRNIFAEEMRSRVQTPCSNALEGCTEYLNTTEISPHLLECDKRYQHTCRISTRLLRSGTLRDIKCEWSGPRRDLLEHVRDTHPEDYSTEECVEWKVEVLPASAFDHARLVVAHGELFWVWLWYSGGAVSLWATYIGYAADACEGFEGRFKLRSRDGRSKWSCSLETIGPNTHGRMNSDILPVMELNQKLMKSFIVENTFTFTVRINKK